MTERTVRDLVRSSPLVQAAPGEVVRNAARRMSEERCGSILVLDEGKLVGIFTERDLLIRVIGAGQDPDATCLRDVMTPDPDTIGADDSPKDAVRRLDQFSYRYLPVIDQGKIIGVLSTRHLPFADVIGMQWELGERHALAERMR
jgi:CBS domain-containing protein